MGKISLVQFLLLHYTVKVYKSVFTDLHSGRYTMEHNRAQCRFTLVKENSPRLMTVARVMLCYTTVDGWTDRSGEKRR